MKNYLKTIALITAVALLWVGCEKDENRIFFEGGTAPTLAISTTNITLTPQTEANQAVRFNWTNPNYKFTTGVSSHDVQYALEFDVNSNFNSPNKFVTTVARDLERSFTVLQLNNLLGNGMQVPFSVPVTVYVRVVSSLNFEGAVNAQLASNAVSFTATAFPPPPVVEPPSTGALYLIGNASSTARGFPASQPDGGWANEGPIPTPVIFSRIGSTHVYELTVRLDGGKSCLFLPVWGSWNVKYGFAGANNTNNPTGGPLRLDGGDVIVPAASGVYKITVNFQNGTFSIVPQ